MKIFRELLAKLYKPIADAIAADKNIEILRSPMANNQSTWTVCHDSLPPGISFSIKSLDMICSPEFTMTLGAYDIVSGYLYKLIASIFIANPEQIDEVGEVNKPDSKLYLNDKSEIPNLLEKVLRTLSSFGAHGDTLLKLKRFVSLTNNLVHEEERQEMICAHFTRGNAYSVIIIPKDANNYTGECTVHMSQNLKGGGGVETMGILKHRVRQGQPDYDDLMRSYQDGAAIRAKVKDMLSAEL